jgi:hypothetical protein
VKNRADDALSARQEAAITALLSEPTIAAAAAKVQANESTVRKWLAKPHFASRYRERRRQLVEVAQGRLQQFTAHATAALVKNLTADRAADQIKAATAILQFATKAVEVADLLNLIENLQRQLDEVKHARNGQAGTPVPAAGAGAIDGNGDAPAPGDPPGPEPHPGPERETPGRVAGEPDAPLFG